MWLAKIHFRHGVDFDNESKVDILKTDRYTCTCGSKHLVNIILGGRPGDTLSPTLSMNGGFLREQHGMIFVWEVYGRVATSLFQHVFIPKKQTTTLRNAMP